jgi:hypothetical protein
MRNLLFALLAVALPAAAQVEAQDPWARATPPGVKVAGGYMMIVNRGSVPDKLLGASSPAAEWIETHVHIRREDDVIEMREVPGFDVPANGRFELKPGGAHLMFMNIKRPFKEGEKIPVKLRFERAGQVDVQFAVRGMGASGHGPMMKH